MTDRGFGYLAILDVEMSGKPTSVAAYVESARGPLQGVVWSVSRQQWTYNPSIVAKFLFDDNFEERGRVVDRETAESIAIALGTRLPTEAELRVLCEAGQADQPSASGR
jgi:hypothetical protein